VQAIEKRGVDQKKNLGLLIKITRGYEKA